MGKKLITAIVNLDNEAERSLWLAKLEYVLTIQDWHIIGDTDEIAFKNSWTNTDSSVLKAAFYIDPFNIVRLKGKIKTGASGTIAFTLPENYRPSEALNFMLEQTSFAAGAGAVVGIDGSVTITRTGANVSLNNISFRV